jgi:hypothetical protein
MTIVPKKKSDSRSSSKSSAVVPKSKQQEQECQDEHHQDQDHHHCRSPHHAQCPNPGDNVGVEEDVDYSGYNSGDEHTHDRRPASYTQWTEQDFQERENQFEKKINKKGWVIRKMAEDGACLFRAVADQIYGDQDMHSVLRKLCIDYIVSIRVYLFKQVQKFKTIYKSKHSILYRPNVNIRLVDRRKTPTISLNTLLRISANI